MFEAGRAAMAAGNYEEACEKFEASMKLDPAPGTLMNLGNCEEKRGHIASAWERYIAAQRDLPETDRRKQFAAQKVRELADAVPHLTITLSSEAPNGTKVHRGDIDLTASLGVPLPLDPGSYAITVTAEGYRSESFSVELERGDQEELQVAPGEALPKPKPVIGTTAPPVVEDQPKWGPLTKRQWGYAAGGVGILGIAAALTSGALAWGEWNTIKKECDVDSGECSSQSGVDARERGDRYALISNITGAIGVIALGTGVYFVLTSRNPGDNQVTTAPPKGGSPKPATGVSAKLEVGTFSGYHGVRMTGRF